MEMHSYYNKGVNTMNKNIIHIYGASGSGTTTLGKRICSELDYTFMDTDDYFWLPTNPKYIEKRDIVERIRIMKDDIFNSENAVISGSLMDWGDVLIPQFTLVVRIETNADIRIERLKNREKKTFRERIEVGGDMYDNHIKFIEWARLYDTGDIYMRSKAKHDKWQELLQCKQILLNGASDLDYNFKLIKEALGL